MTMDPAFLSRGLKRRDARLRTILMGLAKRSDLVELSLLFLVKLMLPLVLFTEMELGEVFGESQLCQAASSSSCML